MEKRVAAAGIEVAGGGEARPVSRSVDGVVCQARQQFPTGATVSRNAFEVHGESSSPEERELEEERPFQPLQGMEGSW
jgi:hypothetical protein